MVLRFAKTRNLTNLALAALIVFAAAVPALLSRTIVGAAQITERSITISSSQVSAADNIYTVDFKPATTGAIEAVIIDFCTSPLVGTACTAPAGLDTNFTTITATGSNGFSTHTFTVDGTESTTNKLVLKDAAGPSVTAGVQSTIALGTGVATNGIDNPSGLGTFYARIITFSTDTDADDYDSTTVNVNNPPSTAVDSGGVALSTADQLTISARVQEQLEFCVAAVETAGDETDCTAGEFASPATEVDLGVIDSTTLSTSPVIAANGGNNLNGAFIIRTNAFNGASVSYYAEDDATEGGRLKVPGVTCNATGAGGSYDTNSNNTDQCFNSESTASDFTASNREQFGMNVNSITDIGTETPGALTAAANYNGTGGGSPNNYAWQEDGTASQLASSGSVLDYAIVELEFAAQSAATTPTGSYNVTSTYIATATF